MAEKIDSDADYVRGEQTSETTIEAHAESSLEEKHLGEEEMPQRVSVDDNDEEIEENANSPPKENAVTQTVSSQSQKMTKSKTVIVMGALCLSVFLAALDMTIVSTALPVMATHFHATQSGYSWMASSYMLANASCTPFWGKLSDIFGRKPIILMSNVLFLVGSLICALSYSIAMNIAGRAIQGAAGGGLIVLANITVSDLFSVRERPMYYGLFGVTWAIAGALGPIIGGAFTTDVTWRWCFYLNLPVGGLSLTILTFFLSIHTPRTRILDGLAAIDWLGVLTCIGATLMFLFGLEFGGVNYPWASATVICLIVFGIVTYGVFYLIEWKVAKYPTIPMRLFKTRQNIVVFAVCFCHSCVFISGSYYMPLYFQSILLASPILSGVYTLPQVLSLSVVSAGTGFFIRKVGRYREAIWIGLAFMTLGYGLFIDLKPYKSWPRIIIYQLIAGAGVGPNFQSPLVALQANVHPSDMATATATFGFIRQIAAAIAMVIGGVIYQNVFAQQKPHLEAILGTSLTSQLPDSMAGGDTSLLKSLPTDQRDAVQSAMTFALSRAWIFYTAMGGVGLVLGFFIKHIELNKSHAIAKTGLEAQEKARKERIAAEKAAKEASSKAEA
ncbi:hypothetical protein UA08_08045 [Talaromyces atroroseus]|uniref:Efflux pump dotC n=1 Tax=Talaromyces atroroseus TaxID=1441469 RepID=A0A225APK9_TALAT|nr:hypothetical protein UA08_08045 [Talaromyces atroroseus]OKL56896.1 hypothetical protein UA08_08045 [Talaromyces atroroseus]